MSINTGLPVPIFNLIKYFCLFVCFDIIVRLSLDKLKSYSRGCRLAHGYSVPISSNAFDRHGLTSTVLKSVSFLQVVVILLILGTYAIEIVLEFSSDSVAILMNVPGEMRVLPAEEKTCGVGATSSSRIVEHMINFASECIVIDEENKNYYMYKANWEVIGSLVVPKCLKTDANILTKGPVPYNETNWIYDQLTGHSDDFPTFGQGPHSPQGLFTIKVTSEDVYIRPEDWIEDHVDGTYRALLPSLKITCHGILCGQKGEKLLRLENKICTRTSSSPASNDADIIFVTGTAVAYSDIADFEKTSWKVSIIANAFFGVQGIRDFSGVITGRKAFSPDAFMMFLGRTHNRDHRSLQKYAIIYKNCDFVQVPSINARPRVETVPNATSALLVRAEVQEWAVTLVATWSLILVFIRVVLGIVVRRQSLPRSLQGEEAMAKLWFNDKVRGKVSEADCDLGEPNARASGSSMPMRGSQQPKKRWNLFRKVVHVQYYLSVKEGLEMDDITVTEGPRRIERDTTKAFFP